jgi:glycerol transport system ATP-binding protein
MFDEPLTVIDPHLKWQLRSKLKELQSRIKRTMIYVTHDQTEALTFADQVVVMNNGEVVQSGTPIELFERPRHTFVGHFIGSPGMNLLPCEVKGGKVFVGGQMVEAANAALATGNKLELGVRPEFVSFAAKGLAAEVVRVSDIGRYRVVEARVANTSVKLIVPEGESIPDGKTHLAFDAAHTQVYADGWIAGDKRGVAA